MFVFILSCVMALILYLLCFSAVVFAIKNKKSKTAKLEGYGLALMFYFIAGNIVANALTKFLSNSYGIKNIGSYIDIFLPLLAIIATSVFVAGLVMEKKESKIKSKERLSKKTADTFDQVYQEQWPNPDLELDPTLSVDNVECDFQNPQSVPELVIEEPVEELIVVP